MSFTYDATGVKPMFELIPDGWYPFRIIEATLGQSKTGFPQVLAKCECLDPRYREQSPIWHFVTFFPSDHKGAFFALQFLKTLGLPHEGKFDVTPLEWVGKKFLGQVITSTYNGKSNNKIDKVSPWRDDMGIAATETEAQAAETVSDSEIPF